MLTAKLFIKGYQYHKLRKAFFSIADTMHCFQNSMSDYNLFYIKAYRNQNFMVNYFCDQFRKVSIRHKHNGYNLNVIRQSSC